MIQAPPSAFQVIGNTTIVGMLIGHVPANILKGSVATRAHTTGDPLFDSIFRSLFPSALVFLKVPIFAHRVEHVLRRC